MSDDFDPFDAPAGGDAPIATESDEKPVAVIDDEVTGDDLLEDGGDSGADATTSADGAAASSSAPAETSAVASYDEEKSYEPTHFVQESDKTMYVALVGSCKFLSFFSASCRSS